MTLWYIWFGSVRLPRIPPVIRFRWLLAFVAGVMAAAPVLFAQAPRAKVPFGVGETMSYDVKFGAFTVGSGRMFVVGIDTVRGQPAWHLRLELRAGIPGFRVENVLESWMDVATLNALRYHQETRQGGKDERRQAEIFPDRRVYHEKDWRATNTGSLQEIDKGEQPTVAQPLDQASFLFFARTQPLEMGSTYSYERYYKPQSNPVTLSVLRREKVNVPAGSFETIVVRPIFKSNGIFGQNGRAEVWFTNDDRRLMVRMETHVAFGSITLQLKEFQGSGVEP
jgi:hypothetical protein